MTGFPFCRNDMAGVYGRIFRSTDIRRDAPPAEPGDAMAQSARAKRIRIFEEARSAVLDRIRQTR